MIGQLKHIYIRHKAYIYKPWGWVLGGFISPTSLPSVRFIYILALDVLVFVYSHCVSFILHCVLLINILCPCQPKTSLGSFVCNTSQM